MRPCPARRAANPCDGREHRVVGGEVAAFQLVPAEAVPAAHGPAEGVGLEGGPVPVDEQIVRRDDPSLGGGAGGERLMVGEAVADDRPERRGNPLDIRGIAMGEIAPQPGQEPRQVGPLRNSGWFGSNSIRGALPIRPGTVTGTIEQEASTPPLP